ncbi:unnamed protein product, partial [Symbiodinium sp. KB8]
VLKLVDQTSELQSGLKATEQKERLLGRLLVYAAVLQDTSDSDNQLALFGFFQEIVKDVSQVNSVQGIWAVSPRHVDLSFPGAFNKVGNRPDFRAFDPVSWMRAVKNYHEGTGLVARADQEMSDPELAKQALEACLQNRVWVRDFDIRYTSIMMASGLVLPFPEEHLLLLPQLGNVITVNLQLTPGRNQSVSQAAQALELLTNAWRVDFCRRTSKSYNRIVGEIDGEAKAWDRFPRLEQWDAILGVDHLDWLLLGAIVVGETQRATGKCLSVLQPRSKLRTAKRLWGMFFALDNAAEYGHWVVDDKAKNIFRNNFNTALDEQGTLRMLKQIHTKACITSHIFNAGSICTLVEELRAHFHPTELFKGELGQVSWADARDLVKPVFDLMANGGYNCAKSPKGDPQQISDPLTVFEYLNFSQRFAKQDASCLNVIVRKWVSYASFNPEDYMPAGAPGVLKGIPGRIFDPRVASYSPSLIMADHDTTEQNYRSAWEFAKGKGIPEERLQKAVRKEQVFVVKFTYEPLNNGMYTGHGLVKRMLPEYGKWLSSLLTAKPDLKAPEHMSLSIPILESTRCLAMKLWSALCKQLRILRMMKICGYRRVQSYYALSRWNLGVLVPVIFPPKQSFSKTEFVQCSDEKAILINPEIGGSQYHRLADTIREQPHPVFGPRVYKEAGSLRRRPAEGGSRDGTPTGEVVSKLGRGLLQVYNARPYMAPVAVSILADTCGDLCQGGHYTQVPEVITEWKLDQKVGDGEGMASLDGNVCGLVVGLRTSYEDTIRGGVAPSSLKSWPSCVRKDVLQGDALPKVAKNLGKALAALPVGDPVPPLTDLALPPMDSALDRVRDRAKASSLSSARPNPSILDELLRHWAVVYQCSLLWSFFRRGKWAKKLVRTRLDDYPSLKGGGLVGETEEVAPWFYRCRYCGRWKDSGAFSSGQVQWASESDFSRGPRRVRREPVCRGCAGFALHLERGVSETEVAGSLPLESRFALIMTFSGEYPGLPEFNEDILRCIFSFLMAPFVADVGDGTFRCTVCMRQLIQQLVIGGLTCTLQPILQSWHWPAAPAEPLPPGPERLPITGPGSGVRLQSRLQAWLSEEAPDRHLREAQLTARADGLWRVE